MRGRCRCGAWGRWFVGHSQSWRMLVPMLKMVMVEMGVQMLWVWEAAQAVVAREVVEEMSVV